MTSLIQRWSQQVPDFLEWTGTFFMIRTSRVQMNQHSFKHFSRKKNSESYKVQERLNLVILFSSPLSYWALTVRWLLFPAIRNYVCSGNHSFSTMALEGQGRLWFAGALVGHECSAMRRTRHWGFCPCLSTIAIPGEQAVVPVCLLFGS